MIKKLLKHLFETSLTKKTQTNPNKQKPTKKSGRATNHESAQRISSKVHKIDKKLIHQFIDGLKVSATLKKELKAITPQNYTGVTAEF